MQTILREHGYQDAYEVIKDKTRGKTLTENEYMDIVRDLEISDEARDQLEDLSPEKYTGWAESIIDKLI
jgi:adenylosuccinate lyase